MQRLASALLVASCWGCADGPPGGDDDSDGSPVAGADGDGDGIPDALEVSGFVVKRGKVVAWDGDPLVPHYFTDPAQLSTDGDPYPDGMEATGRGMDPTVAAPGNHPLVPAMPVIVAVLRSYSVIPLSEVTLGDGTAIARGSAVEESTTRTASRTKEDSWEVGGSVEVEVSAGATWIGTPRGSASVEVSAYFSASSTDAMTEGTSDAVRQSNSLAETVSWSRATSTQPASAARLKLGVRLLNRGTAMATDILPTFGLRIGDKDIATFDPPTDVVALRPGESYPGVGAWVLESDSGGSDITLTLDELRMLQSGAPLTLAVNQVAATVVIPDGIDWTDSGDWDAYQEYIRPISSRILADDGAGGSAEVRVFSDLDDDAPPATLADALAVGFGLSPSDDVATTIDLYTDDGDVRPTSLDGWRIALDPDTWAAHKDELTAPGGNPLALRLEPGMVVRVVPAPGDSDSNVHRAQWTVGGGTTRDLSVAVSDAGFAASTLEVTASVPSVGEVELDFERSTGMFWARDVDLPVGPMLGGLTEVRVRNPRQVEAGLDGGTATLGTSLPHLSRLGGHFTATVEQTVGTTPTDWSWADTYYSTSLSLRTLVGGEALDPSTVQPFKWANPGEPEGGVRIAVNDANETWRLQVLEESVGAGWCALPGTLDIATIERSDLDACSWGSVAGSLNGHPVAVELYVPEGLFAIRFRASGGGAADRVVLFDFKSPPSGSGFLRPGDVDVSFDAYLFTY